MQFPEGVSRLLTQPADWLMGQCGAPAPASAPPSCGGPVCAILQINFTFYRIDTKYRTSLADTNTDIDTFKSFRQFMPGEAV